MSLNKDGLEPGKEIPWAEMRKIQLRGNAKKASLAQNHSVATPTQEPMASLSSLSDPIEIARRSAIAIPDDWEKMKFMTKKSLAHDIAGNRDASKGPEVDVVITAEIERRTAPEA